MISWTPMKYQVGINYDYINSKFYINIFNPFGMQRIGLNLLVIMFRYKM